MYSTRIDEPLIPPYPREHSRYFAEGVVIAVLITLCVAMVPAVIFGVCS